MEFCEKLDFLMNLTNTTNSVLALNIKLDASHISRLRRGQRNAVKSEACVQTMADYFTRHLTQDYQLKALADATGRSGIPVSDPELSEFIEEWLKSGIRFEAKRHLNGQREPSRNSGGEKPGADTGSIEIRQADASMFIGPAGKRQAVILFLTEVLSQGKPLTLLLFSDESTVWMTEDREFSQKWALLMYQVLLKGNKIKIIHTISRNIDEMLNAINQWMPLYMTGAIEPYYYPKIRDGLFRRTLFVAPGVSAVVSSSVGRMLNEAANLLFRDSASIGAYEAEFNQYLKLCRPLMRVYAPKDEPEYFDALRTFEKEMSDAAIKTESLSLVTMPEAVLSGILARIGKPGETILDLHRKRRELFQNNIMSNTCTEVIHLYDAETVKRGNVRVALSGILNDSTVYYTAGDYIAHLENIRTLLDTCENYHISFSEKPINGHYLLYAKEEFGVIIARTSSPVLAGTIIEANMAAAFWDYINASLSVKASPSNAEAAAVLADYIEKLKLSARSRTPAGP